MNNLLKYDELCQFHVCPCVTGPICPPVGHMSYKYIELWVKIYKYCLRSWMTVMHFVHQGVI